MVQFARKHLGKHFEIMLNERSAEKLWHLFALLSRASSTRKLPGQNMDKNGTFSRFSVPTNQSVGLSVGVLIWRCIYYTFSATQSLVQYTQAG